MPTRILLIRHAQSLANLSGFFAGQKDVDLSPAGHEQARWAADCVHRRERVDHILSSDLSRAMHTALPLARLTGLTIQPTQALREIHVPCWEGVSFEQIQERWPKGWDHFWQEPERFSLPGSETFEQLFARVEAAIRQAVQTHPGKTLAVFTHATPIRVLQCRWPGRPMTELYRVSHCPNASLTTVLEEDGHFRPERLGVTQYLPDDE